MSTEVTCIQSPVTHHTLKLFMSADLYDQVREMTDNKFIASNGIKIKCNNRYTPKYQDGTLKLDDQARGRLFILERLKESEKLEAALTELAKGAEFDDSWKVIGDLGKRPGLALSTSSTLSVCYKLFIPEPVYDWAVGFSPFKASNGIDIICRDSCNPGFENGSKDTLYLDNSFRGKEVELNSNFPGLSKLETRSAEILTAFKDLQEGFNERSPPPPPIKILISERAYRFAGRQGHKASNGITVACCSVYRPGFENGDEDHFFINSDYKGKEVEMTNSNFKNYDKFYHRREEIITALAELETKASEAPLKEEEEEEVPNDMMIMAALLGLLERRR